MLPSDVVSGSPRPSTVVAVNLAPGQIFNVAADAAPGRMYVTCPFGQGFAQWSYSRLYNVDIPVNRLRAGYTSILHVHGVPMWVRNAGPGLLQLRFE